MFFSFAPLKGIIMFGRKGKLGLRYTGPFEVLEKAGAIANKLALPPQLSMIHDVFDVSVLRKYISNPSHVLEYSLLQVWEDLIYEVAPIEILGWWEHILYNKTTQWVSTLHYSIEVSTNLEDEILTWWGDCQPLTCFRYFCCLSPHACA